MNKARRDNYGDLISNDSYDLKHLFKVSKNLLSTTVLQPHEDKQQIANEIGAFFIRRIANVRSHHDNHSPQVCTVGSNDFKIDLAISKFNIYVIPGGGARLDRLARLDPIRRPVAWIRFLQN